ncbi:hypothetical protein EK904_012826, partial [Melospiza melodia maxima]
SIQISYNPAKNIQGIQDLTQSEQRTYPPFPWKGKQDCGCTIMDTDSQFHVYCNRDLESCQALTVFKMDSHLSHSLLLLHMMHHTILAPVKQMEKTACANTANEMGAYGQNQHSYFYLVKPTTKTTKAVLKPQ